MTHRAPLVAATIYFYPGGSNVRLECEDCGFITNKQPFADARTELDNHNNRNLSRERQ